jgi:hypothetical protein
MTDILRVILSNTVTIHLKPGEVALRLWPRRCRVVALLLWRAVLTLLYT